MILYAAYRGGATIAHHLLDWLTALRLQERKAWGMMETQRITIHQDLTYPEYSSYYFYWRWMRRSTRFFLLLFIFCLLVALGSAIVAYLAGGGYYTFAAPVFLIFLTVNRSGSNVPRLGHSFWLA
jgi:hypothetical protein